jgi:hypothetical protein
MTAADPKMKIDRDGGSPRRAVAAQEEPIDCGVADFTVAPGRRGVRDQIHAAGT